MSIFLSCANSGARSNADSRSKAIESGRFLVYIEDPNSNSGNSLYNDNIILYDVNGGRSVLLIKDSYLNEESCIGPNGKYVFFVSARKGGSEYLKVFGDEAKRQIYKYNLSTGRVVDVLSAPRNIDYLSLSQSAEGFYFLEGLSNVSFLPADSVRGQHVLQLDSNYTITRLVASPTNNRLVFSYGVTKPSSPWFIRTGIKSLNLRTQNVRDLPLPSGAVPHDLSQGGDSLLVILDSLVIYDFSSHRLTSLHIPDSLSISSPEYWNNDTLVFIGSKQTVSGPWAYDVYFYDMKNRQLTKLTHDGISKSHLEVYNRYAR